jgi:chromatin remodeling complex protein RSC6
MSNNLPKNDILNIINEINDDYNTCLLLLKKIKKNNNKLTKIVKKKKEKKHIKKNVKKGICHKKNIPKKIALFFNLEEDCLMSRIEVTRKFYKYIKENNLYYKKDRRMFIADEKLKKIFNLEDNINDELDIKNKKILSVYTIQTYIKKCYE